jgi:hypothetical protein
MNTSTNFAFPAAWDAQDLADAVPPRLSEAFALALAEAANQPAAGGAAVMPRSPRPWRAGYARPPALPVHFRVV